MKKTLFEFMLLFLLSLSATVLLVAAKGPPSWKRETVCAVPVPSQPQVAWIEPNDAAALLNGSTLFLDARDPAAYEQGHIAGAISVPAITGVANLSSIASLSSIPNLESHAFITYCDTQTECAASVRLAEILASRGIKQVAVLKGGFPDWMKMNLPAESGKPTRGP